MTPACPVVFLDSNILFSRALRDWICLLCNEGDRLAYDLRWSEDVLAEWMYRGRRANPAHGDVAVGGQRRRLVESFPAGMITGYDFRAVPELADPDDRHVLAAALHGEVDVLITNDRRADFEAVAPEGLEVCTADEFLLWVQAEHSRLIPPVLRRQIGYFQRKHDISESRARQEIVEYLVKAGASGFARRVDETTLG